MTPEKITLNIEEEYEDIIQNLEESIVMCYLSHPDLIDAEVETAMDWLVKLYSAQAQGKTSSYQEPTGVSAEVANSVQQMCEWRLGREKLAVEDEAGQIIKLGIQDLELEKLELKQIVICLKRIQSSIKLWANKTETQGYFHEIAQFMETYPNYSDFC